MKKRLIVILMMLCAVMLTGCVNADVTVDLEKDGTGKAIVKLVGPSSVFDNIPKESINEWGKSFEKVEKITESDKVGYKFTTRQGKIDEVLKEVADIGKDVDEEQLKNSDETSDSASVQQTSSSNNQSSKNLADEFYEKYVSVQEENKIFSNTYDISIKLKDAIYSQMSDEEKTIIGFLGKSANIGIHIKSPIEAKSNNATSQAKEDGKYVYNWEYTLSDIQNINFSANIPNIKNIAIAAVCGIIVLLILIKMAFRKRK